MTNYEMLLKGFTENGPQAMAEIFTEIMRSGIKAACEKAGIPFKSTDEMKRDIVDQYVDFLNSEYEEKKND